LSFITRGLGGTHLITGGYGYYWIKKFKEAKRKLQSSPRIYICPSCGSVAIYDTKTALGGMWYLKDCHRLYWHCTECGEMMFTEDLEPSGGDTLETV
jgi:transcription elongation factor Elf1